MQVSARILGRSYGLTAEEMNRVLLKLGFLKGVPGDYEPTEKAFPYVIEKNHHRGPGGAAQYNRDWITRTFDDSIKEALIVTDELKTNVRNEISDARAARREQQKIMQDNYERNILANNNDVALCANRSGLETNKELLKNIGLISAGTLALIGLGYGIYKTVVYIKKKKDLQSESDKKKLRS